MIIIAILLYIGYINVSKELNEEMDVKFKDQNAYFITLNIRTKPFLRLIKTVLLKSRCQRKQITKNDKYLIYNESKQSKNLLNFCQIRPKLRHNYYFRIP